MNYYDLRKQVSRIIPRMAQLTSEMQKAGIKEKGRKANYSEFSLIHNQFIKRERLLNEEEVSSFLEISIRAAACPMPLNIDVFDSTRCAFACKYCFADAFRATLYSAFFDNSKTMGIRHCNPDFYKKELDKLMPLRGSKERLQGFQKAIALDIPMRFGIRFEDFLPIERKFGISLELLRYLSNQNYPVMINTKSALIGEED